MPHSLARSIIDAADRASSPADLRALLSYLDASAFLDIISDVTANDSHELSALASNSFRHRNGFIRLVLALGDDCSSKLRVHLWSGQQRSSQIHNHSWHFASRIMHGALEAQEYELAAAGADAHQISVIPNKSAALAGRESRLEPSPVSPRATKLRRYYTGDLYNLAAGKFHAVHAIEAASVTLVLQGSHVFQESRVLVPLDAASTAAVLPLSISAYLHFLAVASSLVPTRLKRSRSMGFQNWPGAALAVR